MNISGREAVAGALIVAVVVAEYVTLVGSSVLDMNAVELVPTILVVLVVPLEVAVKADDVVAVKWSDDVVVDEVLVDDVVADEVLGTFKYPRDAGIE
mmetsp:Transcript_47729/g.123823  ORF Transcript_47729/g.123823 Transcript_47729/m.123823 type:complete len:97 (-) Transcript_47729:184-474(-)